MNSKSLYTAAVVAALAASSPLLAGRGGGGGMGQSGYQTNGGMPPGPAMTQERRSDKALQQDRDREQYRGAAGERDTHKAKAKGPEQGSGEGDRLRSQERVTDQERVKDQQRTRDND